MRLQPRRKSALLLTVATFAFGLAGLTRAPAASAEDTARVGPNIPAARTYTQEIPVNVVLVGYDRSEVGPAIRNQLASSGTPIVRTPEYYGLHGRELGLRFTYDYRIIEAQKSFEDGYFAFLRKIGTPSAPTTFQRQYNAQRKNLVDVTGPILNIEASSAEKWLEDAAASQLGIDNAHSYTVFLVNWWGRSDFRFHLYRNTDSPDPDTGVVLKGLKDSRLTIAWGGTSGRSWFYDLSAGPESWTENWNVTDADVDGDGVADYRMPPIWEYAAKGYRQRKSLGPDLGLVVRYVAVDLLFTTSPLYDPLVTAPAPGGGIRVPITLFEDDAATQGTDWIHPAKAVAEWRALEPWHDFSASLTDVSPITWGPKHAFRIFTGLDPGDRGCWQRWRTTFAELFCFFDNNEARYFTDTKADYEAPVIAFNTTDARMGDWFGLQGFADDNWVDGTQQFTYLFSYPFVRKAGYGFTFSLTHEIGHQMGLSHPHDGYDPATGQDYYAYADKFFAWSGDESDTVMSYLGVSPGFSQFDRDNMARWWFAGYANWTKALIAAIEGSGSTDQRSQNAVGDAKASVWKATKFFEDWHYVEAATEARHAYGIAQTEATRLGVGESTANARVAPADPEPVPRRVDPIRFPTG